ncbi:MAG: hypothetical protein AAF633_23350, partial [Chloroflexota bacterium]
QRDIRKVITQLCQDLSTIQYRQAILKDILDYPAIAKAFETLLPQITALNVYRNAIDRKRVALQELAWRASELDYLVNSITTLSQTFGEIGDGLKAEGLKRLREVVHMIEGDETYQKLRRELPEILPKLRANVSVTIGVNLDSELRPIEAVLLSVNDEAYAEAPFLERLLGRQDEWNGIAKLHKAPTDIYGGHRRPNGSFDSRGSDPMMAPLFRDLSDVMKKTIRPLEQALKQYLNINGRFLDHLREEIGFYVAACQLHKRLVSNEIPTCIPEILPAKAGRCQIEAGHNLNLVRYMLAEYPGLSITDKIIPNDVEMGDQGRIFILTGPNQGGKTTYTQMIGLNQILAQAGLFIPAKSGSVSIVDQIYTHYPVEEQLEKETGRFGDEALRLSEIFDRATEASLILLNESLTGTGPGEAIYLAQDIIKVFNQMGCRVVFNTHLHELARSTHALAAEGETPIVSLVASRIEGDPEDRSYRILPGEPLGRSYAREIAARYGISYEQLIKRINERGLIHEDQKSPQNGNI